MMSLTHSAWQFLVEQLRIVDGVDQHGHFDLSAEQIKTLTGQEPRLMTKFDCREHLPAALRDQQLSVLAIQNGLYRIARNDPFIDIPAQENTPPEKIFLNDEIVAFDPSALTSESSVLEVAMATTVLEKVFGEVVVSTNPGRHYCNPFEFSLGGIAYPVRGVQLEIDGLYQGTSSLHAVEAKMGTRSNVSMRQLVYPQLSLSVKAGLRRAVRSYVLFYDEPFLRFIPIAQREGCWIALADQSKLFQLFPFAKLNLKNLDPSSAEHTPVLGTPFPQADKFSSVLTMFNLVAGAGSLSKKRLAELFETEPDPRHVNYYFSTLRWLGVVTVKRGVVQLTELGQRLAKASHAVRMQAFASIIFSEPIFQHALHQPGQDVPESYFTRWNCASDSTRTRRLHTVRAWLKYFQDYEAQPC